MIDSHYEAIDAWDKLISTLYGEDGKRQIEIFIERIELGFIHWLPRWTVLVGKSGTGKTTLDRIIFQMFNDIVIPLSGGKPMNYGEYNDGTLGICPDGDFAAMYEHVTKTWHTPFNYHLLVSTNRDVLLPKTYECIEDDGNKIAKFVNTKTLYFDDIELIHTTGKRFMGPDYRELISSINDGVSELKLYFHEKARVDFMERRL